LVELLAVITIIGILAATVLGFAGYAQRRAAANRTQAELKALELAIENYKLDNGAYPASSADRTNMITNCGSLYSALVTGKRYFDFKPNQLRVSGTVTNVLDAYGNPYNYFSGTPKTNAVTFDLWSYGPDGQSSTSANMLDDITNWK
jgi:general secretion pathway protein G